MATPVVDSKIFTAIGLDFETGGLDCTRCACTQIAVQAIRLDTLEVFDRYAAYISPYHKQELGAAKRKVLKTRHELSRPSERMDYEQVALDTQVRIVRSQTLIEMRLIGLVGRGGRVVEQIITNGDNLHGYMVCMDETFMGECLWFVPANAVHLDE